MFGIGLPELIIILVIALLIFGPKKLPEISKVLGKGMHELKRATDDLKDTWEAEVEAQEEEARKIKQAQQEALPAAASPETSAQAGGTPPASGEEIYSSPSLAYPGEDEILQPHEETAVPETQTAGPLTYPAEEELTQSNPEVITEKEERSPKTNV